ncbi:restriction endonuclease [Sulfitobacter sp. 1A13353]|uniref:restriction endonuclease n=1 Tax=Sulfitobacter sp. 1A13353 TaxID=3368568 RepID=UPI0037470C7F
MTSRRVWLIRPPKVGNYDERAIDSGVVTGEFSVREDLSDHLDYEMILEEVVAANPREKTGRIENLGKQLHLLLNEIQAGDLVMHPHNQRKCVAIGIFRSGSVADDDGRPGREVEWLRKGISKTDLHPDFHHSMSAGNQICELSRNNALARVEALVADGKDPGPAGTRDSAAAQSMDPDSILPMLEARMRAQVGSTFAGHDLARLVGALLEIEGYKVTVAPPGPDGGCDLLAARGGLGIEGPTIAGQVKSGDIVVDEPTLQGLRGVIQARGADKGLLVSWSGVTRPVARELSNLQLQIAYWDATEICSRLIQNYDSLPLWIRDRLLIRMVPLLEAV